MQQALRLGVACDYQRLGNITRAHVSNHRIHVPSLASIAHRQFIFRRSQTQRSDHHGGQRVGEFTFEHGAFAGDHTVTFSNFAVKHRREHIRQVHLLRAFEISLGAPKILGHHAEIHIVRAQHVPYLVQHLVNAHVATGIARAVIPREQQTQFFAALPALAATQHPLHARHANQRANPRY